MSKVRTSAILLAGGSGTRMESPLPKQYLEIDGKPIVKHSFDLFLDIDEIDEIVVVCAAEFRHHFADSYHKPVFFALPGARRQDSLLNGLRVADPSSSLICVHDAARPLIDRELVSRVIAAGIEHGAATVGMPVKSTIKMSKPDLFVERTLDRSFIWEIQTPQVLRRDILEEGFGYVELHKITVTDDVALAELIGKPVKLVEGSYANIKITTQFDLQLARGHVHV